MADNPQNVQENAATFHCIACGAPLTYAPDKNKFVCEYCDSEFTREELKQHEEQEALEAAKRLAEDEAYNAKLRAYVRYAFPDVKFDAR